MKIDVLYQFNELYAPYAGVSMVSLFENNKHIDEIVVHVMDDEISPVSKLRLMQTAEDYGRKIDFIDTRELIDTMVKLNIPKYRGSYAANLKLFLPMVINGNIDKLLYIDSDTVVCGNIEPLFELNMEDYPLAMSYDSLGKKHKRLIGLNEDDGYYNTGVILFNIDAWKQKMCTEMIVEHVKHVRAHYMSPDQDLINVVLRGQIFTIGPEYNLQPVHLVYKYGIYRLFFGQRAYHSRDEIKSAVKSPAILHFFRFLGQFPWDKDSVHPDTEQFDKYMTMSRWSDYEKLPAKQSQLTFKIERWLYKYMPPIVFLVLFKVNYEVFIKKSETDSRKMLNNEKM